MPAGYSHSAFGHASSFRLGLRLGRRAGGPPRRARRAGRQRPSCRGAILRRTLRKHRGAIRLFPLALHASTQRAPTRAITTCTAGEGVAMEYRPCAPTLSSASPTISSPGRRPLFRLKSSSPYDIHVLHNAVWMWPTVDCADRPCDAVTELQERVEEGGLEERLQTDQ